MYGELHPLAPSSVPFFRRLTADEVIGVLRVTDMVNGPSNDLRREDENFLARDPRTMLAIFFLMCEGIETPPGFWGETTTPLLERATLKCVQHVLLLISMLFVSRASCISLTTALLGTFDSPDGLYLKSVAVAASFKYS